MPCQIELANSQRILIMRAIRIAMLNEEFMNLIQAEKPRGPAETNAEELEMILGCFQSIEDFVNPHVENVHVRKERVMLHAFNDCHPFDD